MYAHSVPASQGLGQFTDEAWYPFSHMSFTMANYAVQPHRDIKDVGMGFISWYLKGMFTSAGCNILQCLISMQPMLLIALSAVEFNCYWCMQLLLSIAVVAADCCCCCLMLMQSMVATAKCTCCSCMRPSLLEGRVAILTVCISCNRLLHNIYHVVIAECRWVLLITSCC